MGCDIHMYVEVKTDGVWNKVGDVFKSAYYDAARETKTYSDGYVSNAPMTDEPYEHRNYEFFAILADVRNGYVFASKKNQKPVKPLFARRGVPVDASTEYKEILEMWDCDAHSASYATLAELQAIDWNDLYAAEQGLVDATEYERIRGTDMVPESWCMGASGPYVQTVTPEVYEREYRNVITDKAVEREEMMSVYIAMQWIAPVAYRCSEFIQTTIPAVAELGAPDDVRIVFFFDN